MVSDLASLLPHLPGLLLLAVILTIAVKLAPYLLLAVILTIAVKLAPYLEKGHRNDWD